MEVAGEQLPSVVELRLYETIDPLRMTTLSLAALLAVDDNAIIHKLRVLPVDQLLTLLQLPIVDLTQIAAISTPDELGWLAGHLATIPSQEASTVAHEVASGKVTIAMLHAPTVAVAPSGEIARNSRSSQGEASTEASPVATMPDAVVAWWTPWINNGIAVATGVVVLLLIAVGVAVTLRREITDPPV
jgi:hypothetical protein